MTASILSSAIPCTTAGGNIGDVTLTGDEAVTFTALGQVSGVAHTA